MSTQKMAAGDRAARWRWVTGPLSMLAEFEFWYEERALGIDLPKERSRRAEQFVRWAQIAEEPGGLRVLVAQNSGYSTASALTCATQEAVVAYVIASYVASVNNEEEIEPRKITG